MTNEWNPPGQHCPRQTEFQKETRKALSRVQTSTKTQQFPYETTFKFTRSEFLLGSAQNCTHS